MSTVKLKIIDTHQHSYGLMARLAGHEAQDHPILPYRDSADGNIVS